MGTHIKHVIIALIVAITAMVCTYCYTHQYNIAHVEQVLTAINVSPAGSGGPNL